MLHLCYSNRLEALCAPLAARVRAVQQKDPLSPVHILVPNPAVDQFLRFELAEQNGIAANLEIGLIRRYLSQLVEDTEPSIQVLDKDRLQLVLNARLQRDDFLKRHRLEAVEEYLEYARSDEERQRRSFLLAGVLARLFEEYGYSRRMLLEAWSEGRTTTQDTWLETERWQRRLWRSLFDKDRCLLHASPSNVALDAQPGLFTDPTHRVARHMMLMDAFEHVRGRLTPPASLHIFGVSYVSTAFAEVFARLAAETDLYVYAQNPCMEFWEDLQSSGLASLRSDWARRHDPFNFDSGAADPFDLESFADTPALRLWARPGREYVRLLNALSHCEFAPGFVDPITGGDTLLTRVQRDILTRTPEPEIRPMDTIDTSVKFLPCPSLTREVEAIAERIWHLVGTPVGPEQAPLRFHEIAVFVTDGERERYLAHIADTFAHRDGIPFRILDQTLSHGTGVLDCLRQLLRVLGSRFERSLLIDLLLHPQFKGPTISERVHWQRWLDQLQVRWGVDAQDFESTYLQGQRYDWASNLQRLLIGQFTDDGVTASSSISPCGSDGIVALSTPAETRDLVGSLLQTIRDLSADTQAVQRARMSLKDWCALMGRVLTRYIQVESPADESALAQCMRALDRLADKDLEETSLAFPMIDELLKNELKSLDSRRSQHRADGVVVSSLMPMRAIPFRAVFVLGLGEGQFPASEVPDPLDLRLARRHVGDVSAAERDRYIFLETLLATRESLCLSWVARNPVNGEPLEASPVVKEFEYVLRSYLAPDALRTLTQTVSAARHNDGAEMRPGRVERYHTALEHLWHGSSAPLRGLGHRAILDSTSEGDRASLKALFRTYPLPIKAPPEPGSRISMKALERFLTSPLQGSTQYTLGLYERTQPDPLNDSEPMELSPPVQHRLLEECFWSLESEISDIDGQVGHLFERARLTGETPAGLFAEAMVNDSVQVIQTWFRNASELGLTPLKAWKTIAIGPCAERAQFDHQIPALEVALDEQSICVIHGVALRLHPQRHAMMRCVAVKKASPAHYLSAFLSLVVLSASGARFPDIVRVIINCTDAEAPPDYRDYWVPPRDVCQEWLRQISRDLLSGFHGYRLPIDVVLSWFNRRQRTPDAGPYLPPNGRTADDRGPVKDLEAFDLPVVEDAEDMVRRRYDLWFRAGHR